MKIEKKQFHGSLDFLEGELYKVEIFFDDTAKDVINKKTEVRFWTELRHNEGRGNLGLS